MSVGTGQGRFSHWPRTLDRLANTGSVQKARQSLRAKHRNNIRIIWMQLRFKCWVILEQTEMRAKAKTGTKTCFEFRAAGGQVFKRQSAKKKIRTRQPQPYFALRGHTLFREQSTSLLIMTSLCSHLNTHRDRQIHLLCNFSSNVKSLFKLWLTEFVLGIHVCVHALLTVTLPVDAAQSGGGGDAVWSAVEPLFSVNQLLDPFQISDTCQPSSYQTQTLPLPEGSKVDNKSLPH